MTNWDLAKAFGNVSPKYVKDIDVFFKRRPLWRYIMKKSVKFAATAAAAVVTLGVIVLTVLLQTNPQTFGGPAASQPGASAPLEESEPVTLRVVVERGAGDMIKVVEKETGDTISDGWSQTEEYGQWNYLREFAMIYELKHEGSVKIELESLPSDEKEREITLQKLRTEILAGKGPDVFILPTCAMSLVHSPYLEPLFQNVEQSMYGGSFLDISQYYDADEDLDREGLNQQVMDGGCVGDARYVLPLRYSIPVMVMDEKAIDASGIDKQALTADMGSCYETVAAHGDPTLTFTSVGTLFDGFPKIYQCEDDTVALEQEELTAFLERYQKYTALNAQEPYRFLGDLLGDYLNSGEAPINETQPLYGTFLGRDVLVAAALAKETGADLRVVPMKAYNGEMVAKVNYWGAVGSSSQHPQEAYDFLSYFLSPEVQLESGLLSITNGWPVRIADSAKPLWKTLIKKDGSGGASELKISLLDLELDDSDVPALQTGIDEVCFETVWEAELAREVSGRLFNWETKEPAEDPAAVAQDVIDTLRVRIQE